MTLIINVPATSANLGPGFDALGLALDLWNESTFEPADDFSVHVEGEGEARLARDRKNLILRAAHRLAERVGKGLRPFVVRCTNRIPLGSGLGSSAAATLTGLLAANVLTRAELSDQELLSLATEIEGHPDNVAPALLGGLVVSAVGDAGVVARRLPFVPLPIAVVVPEFRFPTRQARRSLPAHVRRRDAVQNISRALLVADALRTGDQGLLAEAMADLLHQPYRLPQIPGAEAAMQAMKSEGAAVALSGAGPSLIAFTAAGLGAGLAGRRAFEAAGVPARVFELGISSRGAEIHTP